VSYQSDLKQHLAEFKRKQLGIEANGVFRHQGRVLELPHILPLAMASANLFEEAAALANEFLAANPGTRHRYFHHLNSSQAFAFNLFFPFFSGEPTGACALLRAFGQTGRLVGWEAEAVPAPDEGSNIDVSWVTTDGVRTFCEVKLSEVEFGKATDDARHRSKLSAIYRTVLDGHLEPARLEPRAFFTAYQFNRNLWHMARVERSRLVFLLPRSNSGLWQVLHGLLSGVAPATRGRISVAAIEDVIGKICADGECPDTMRAYAGKLRRKYVMTSG
jgi:hypothetical protein